MPAPERVTAMVLAAGESTRMGGFPKPLLDLDGRRFVERILSTLDAAGIDEVVVVLGHEREEVLERADLGTAEWTANPGYRDGMLSSVQCGVRRARNRDADAALLWPVDFPLVSPSVVSGLVEGLSRAGDDVAIPVVAGERGHPALFARSTFEALLEAPPDEGARAVVYDESTVVTEVDCEDETIFVDIDTPAEYWAAVKAYT